jgi:hypothetical protein
MEEEDVCSRSPQTVHLVLPLVICYSDDAASVLAFQRGGLRQLQAAFPVYSCVLELCGVVSYSQHPCIVGRKALLS